MTMNDSWGYQTADDDWKTPKTIVRNLVTCARDGGNYLLNIGPKPDGSIPEESVRILTTVGKWMERNGTAIYADRCVPAAAFAIMRASPARATRSTCTSTSGRARPWRSAGMQTQVKCARLLATGKTVKFEQDQFRVRFTGLPEKAPDEPMTTLAIECDGEPKQGKHRFCAQPAPAR